MKLATFIKNWNIITFCFLLQRAIFNMRMALATVCAIMVATTYFSNQTILQLMETAEYQHWDLTQLNVCVVERQ